MDTRDTRLHNLLFLLAAAPLGMGGCIITDGEDDGADTGNVSTGGQPNTSGETEPATDGETEQATAADGTSTGTPPDTDGPMDTTAGDDTTTGGSGNAVCEEYGIFITGCYSQDEGTAAQLFCDEYLGELYDTYGANCSSVYEDYVACLSKLTCEEFMAPDACSAELSVVMMECVAK